MPGVWTPAEGPCGLVGVVMTLTMRQQKAWFGSGWGHQVGWVKFKVKRGKEEGEEGW